MKELLQPWVKELSLMQQTVLLGAIRGPDGTPKGHRCKPIIRYYRRVVLTCALDGSILTDPFVSGGGDFMGPLKGTLQEACDDFLKSRDDLSSHYYEHCMHAFEIVGYKHSDSSIRGIFRNLYVRQVRAKHLYPESEAQLDERLGDDETAYWKHADPAGTCST